MFIKKTINVTTAYSEPLVQSIVGLKTGRWISCGTAVFESSLCYYASVRVLRCRHIIWVHIIWVKESALLAQDSCCIHQLFDSEFHHTASTIVIYIDIARIFHTNIIGLSWEEFHIEHKTSD